MIKRCVMIMSWSMTFALSAVALAAAVRERTMSNFAHEEAAMPYMPRDEPASAIEQVLRTREGELLTMPGVTGVAVGKSPTGDPAIVIYLIHVNYRSTLPREIDGYPVVIQV